MNDFKRIAHRGLLSSSEPEDENSPDLIHNTCSYGFDCEVDIWFIDHKFYLGHDEPKYMIQTKWLSKHKEKLWIHCKNLSSLEAFLDLDLNFNFFWHQNDDHTLTSHGFIWTFPGLPVTSKSVLVVLDKETLGSVLGSDSILYGICSKWFIAS